MNASSLARVIPALGWLRTYDRSWLRSDVFAGITLAAYLLPAGLGDASLSKLTPEAVLSAASRRPRSVRALVTHRRVAWRDRRFRYNTLWPARCGNRVARRVYRVRPV